MSFELHKIYEQGVESNHGHQGHEPCTLPLSYLASFFSIIFLVENLFS